MSEWKNNTALAKPVGFWLCIGLAAGSALGVAMEHFALGISTGILIGAVIGFLQKKKKDKADR